MSPRRIPLIVPFVLGAVAALLWRSRRPASVSEAPAVLAARPAPPPATDPPPTFAEPKLRAPRLQHRLAVAAFAVMFFAGAALSAGAGDRVGALLDEGAPAAETTAAEPSAAEPSEPADPAAAAPAPAADAASAGSPAADEFPAAPEAAPGQPAAESAPEPASTQAAASAPAAAEPSESPETAKAQWTAPAASPAPAVRAAKLQRAATPPVSTPAPARAAPPLATPRPDPEVDAPGSAAVVWVNAQLPDPIPPSARLSARFANRLRAASLAYGVDWALLLGAYRADGSRGSLRAAAARLNATAGGPWTRVLAGTGNTGVADRAVALAHYNRIVGLSALVHGFDGAKHGLAARLLADPRVVLMPSGRADIQAGRVDVRVLAVIGYLADTFGSVTVSSLETGHRLFARPGVVSAHIYGRAVDIAALAGTPIAGNQEPGGLTEHAVRALLLLPPEVRPLQVISLLGLGGPSFPLADHRDHVHVGF